MNIDRKQLVRALAEVQVYGDYIATHRQRTEDTYYLINVLTIFGRSLAEPEITEDELSAAIERLEKP